MSERSAYKELINYVDKANALAESIKRNILHRSDDIAVIDDETVVALNEFIIASNSIKDMTDELINQDLKYN